MDLDLRSAFSGLAVSAVLFIATLIAFVLFCVQVATRSHPQPGKTSGAQVTASTTIYRNNFGIPHIVGETTEDVVFAQGFAHAQDRMWQMDVWRRIGNGRLAEILGAEAVSVDAFMRAIGIRNIVKKQWSQLPEQTKKLLVAYSNGVNTYINENRHALSLEFDAIDYVPDQWQPTDCLVVGRVIAFELSIAFWNDLAYAQIVKQRGLSAAQDYVPSPQGPPYVLSTSVFSSPPHRISAVIDSAAPAIESTTEALASLRSVLGYRGSAPGSNCWVTSNNNRTLLANDPHLGVSMPNKWYQVHLTSNEINALGVSIPGIPFVVSGRNDAVAWGVTNAMVDDVDYILERMDQKNNNYYLDARGKRQKIRFVQDTIKVKGAPDTVMYLRYTNNGCIVSDHHLLRYPKMAFKRTSTSSTEWLESHALTFRWTAQYPSDEVGALYNINKAQTISNVTAAVRTWNTPAFVMHVAEKQGKIATLMAGAIPNRTKCEPLIPSASWDKTSRWNGLVRLSTLENESGISPANTPSFRASANNALTANAEPFVTTLYQPSSRIKRINELIGVYTRMDVRDAQVMQQDVKSPYAVAITKQLLPYLTSRKTKLSSTAQKALRALKKWDGSMASTSKGAAVYSVFLERMFYNTFEDELGANLYVDWSYYTPNVFNVFERIVQTPKHTLFNDVRTKEHEDLGWIALRSFAEAVEHLRVTCGNDVKTWEYGKLHTVEFPHLVGESEVMAPVMNLGPFEHGGDLTTVNNAEWSLSRPFNTTVVASSRLISDMSDTVQYTVVPGGSSGEPLTAHYSDQIQLWLRGGYVRLPVAREPASGFSQFHVFTP